MQINDLEQFKETKGRVFFKQKGKSRKIKGEKSIEERILKVRGNGVREFSTSINQICEKMS